MLLKNETLTTPAFKDTLLGTSVTELKATPKNLWVGTDGRGVYSYSNSGVQHLKATDDLSVQTIIDEGNVLWLATNKGVKKVVLKTPLSESVITNSFYESDGLLQNNINDIFLKDGFVYAATDAGLSKIDPNDAVYKKSLQIYFENRSDTLTIKQNENRNITVSFYVTNYGSQQHLVYKYRLLPQQEEWIETQTQLLNFSSLPPEIICLK
ncbi:hypothetical protein [Niabella ginsengisoli]|uniref:Two component regulator three Y domain-containing protein n=1 Tax=Niabella ginsengisoli TaxID=522298 RepID=A0ABS9SQ78_9BACT|nr:hypothetical protein [Niabella ginsengisoli]MCH5600553.1 hypothetical protein [Niabella ginsengisoli]